MSACSRSPPQTGSMRGGPQRSARANAAAQTHARISNELLDGVPGHCGLVTVLMAIRQHWRGWAAVSGHRVRSLGVEHFGQTGSIADLYRHYGIDADAISPRRRRWRRDDRSGTSEHRS